VAEDEGGAAALVLPVAVILFVVACLSLADLGGWLVVRARAATAADAAALAAAVEVALGGPGDPALQAERLARANSARLVACRCPVPNGTSTFVVRVDVPFRGRLLGRSRIGAWARADARADGRNAW
jgi:secretion/DNA translocation related TadE-like protein